MSNPIKTLAVTLFLEAPGRKLSPAGHAERLEQSGREIAARAQAVAGTPAHREVLAHLTGIERWGQRRLRVFLGQPPAADEYDGYRPAAGLDWASLKAAFASARQETVELARQLEARQPAPGTRVEHNQFGGLSAAAWLQYLRQHASLESKKIR